MEKATSARPRNRPKFLNALPAEGSGVIGADFRGPNIVVIAGSLRTGVGQSPSASALDSKIDDWLLNLP
jgi:hypothetical protein